MRIGETWEDFRDVPRTVEGSIYGVRYFKVKDTGRLIGATRDEEWRNGPNRAECLVYAWQATQNVRFYGDAYTSHRCGSKMCTCGFYAYFGDTPDHAYGHGTAAPFTVVGIIEGWGCGTVGTRGFRVENAMIVALVRPTQMPMPERMSPKRSAFDNWPRVSSLYPTAIQYPTIQDAQAVWPCEMTPRNEAA